MTNSRNTAKALLNENNIPANVAPIKNLLLICPLQKNCEELPDLIPQVIYLPTAFELLGQFVEQSKVSNPNTQKFLQAINQIKSLSAQLGSPQALSQQLATNPAILQSQTAPQEIYTKIVWVETLLYQVANSFQQTLSQFPTVLNSTPSNQRLQTLQELLTGSGGLQSTILAVIPSCQTVSQAISSYDSGIGSYVSIVEKYLGSGNILSDILEAEFQSVSLLANNWDNTAKICQLVADNVKQIATTVTEKDLENVPQFIQTFGITQATQSWNSFAETMQEYTSNALVTL